MQGYIWLRALDFGENEVTQVPSLRNLAIYIIILPYFCYAIEMEERKLFQKAHNLESHLSMFETLMKEVIPSVIVIISQGEAVFFNERMQEIFNVSSSSEVKCILRSFQVNSVFKIL